MNPAPVNLIALDGPGGVGKSTVARALAERLGYYYLSSGLIYRCMAWYLARRGWDGEAPPDPGPLEGFTFRVRADGAVEVNGSPGESELKSDAISSLASRLSTRPEVRERANRLQREVVGRIAAEGAYPGVVLEGRDIGTVVFPDAPNKFYLTAREEVRAHRRYLELRGSGENPDREQVVAALRERDERDRTRAVAPLKRAEDAGVIDTSDLSVTEVVEAIIRRLKPAVPRH